MILRKHAKTAVQPGNSLANEITFKFLPELKTFEQDGKKYCRLTASSSGEDLVGDIMSEAALNQMKTAAAGTAMFMNHSTNVPEDVFGTVVEAELKKETVELVGGGRGDLVVLHYLVQVEEANDRAVKCWEMIAAGTKLGASVTVLVTKKTPNPNRKKGIVIEGVEYLECSVVGMPCNRQSWAYAASKALELAEKRAARQETEEISPEINEKEEEEYMKKEKELPGETGRETKIETNESALPPADSKAASPAADPAESELTSPTETRPAVETSASPAGRFFTRTLAAIAAVKSLREQIAAKAELTAPPEGAPEVWRKGLFNDILAQKPTFWDLCDILSSVRWMLIYQIDNLKYVGSTDFSAVRNAWSEALDEFKSAQIDSFDYWQKIEAAEPAGDDLLEAYSVAGELEKSITVLAEAMKDVSDRNLQAEFLAAGERILGLAKTLGIVKDTGLEDGQLPATESEPMPKIEKSAAYVELKARYEEAEADRAELRKKLDETVQNYEIAKAGLKAANAALDNSLRQPLVTAQGTPATS